MKYLLISLLIIGSCVATKFHFQAKLICGLELSSNDYYQYSVSHWERDRFTADDSLDTPKIGKANSDLIVFSDGYQTDDGAGFANFEVYSYIKHNCTESGDETILEIDLGTVRVALSDATLKYDAVLYSRTIDKK